MSNKAFNTRIRNKRDTAANWEKVASTFQPLDGEMIIVDTAAGATRFKVGRYDSAKGRLLYYNELPFTDEPLYNCIWEQVGRIPDHTHAVDDVIDFPDSLPNPNQLTFIGAVEEAYDGSSQVTVNIPNVPDIPTPTQEDAGKVLTVDANGAAVWAAVTNAEEVAV